MRADEPSFERWTELPLRSARDCKPGVVQLPRQAYPDANGLPRFLLVRRGKGRRPIVGALGWWGSAELAEGTAVRVNPDRFRAVYAGGPRPGGNPFAEVRAAGWRHVARYGRGFRVPALIALLTAAAAIVGAIVTLCTSTAPFGLVLALVALVAVVAVAKAFWDVTAAARG